MPLAQDHADPHASVRTLCDRIRALARAIVSLKDRTKVIDAADSIEVLTSSYMVAEEPFDWYRYGATGTEKKLAELLRLSFGRARSKETLVNALYFDRGGDVPDVKIIDVFVCKLRKKLELTGCPYRIETAWGYGYRLVVNSE